MKASDKCHYPGCPRKRGRGWTTCGRHHTAGISIRQWNKRQPRDTGTPLPIRAEDRRVVQRDEEGNILYRSGLYKTSAEATRAAARSRRLNRQDTK